jgi:hypothetical protein
LWLAVARRTSVTVQNAVPAEVGRYARITVRQARRVVVVTVGSTLLLLGLAMVVLPGPAFVIIPLGLGVLAIEFAWARRWLVRIRQTARQLTNNQHRQPARIRKAVAVVVEADGS